MRAVARPTWYLQQVSNNSFGQHYRETIDDTHVTTAAQVSLITCGESYINRAYRIADTEHQTATVVELFRYNFRCAAGSKLDFEFRQSVYEGIYEGPYKPYVGSQLYASQAELRLQVTQLRHTWPRITPPRQNSTTWRWW